MALSSLSTVGILTPIFLCYNKYFIRIEYRRDIAVRLKLFALLDCDQWNTHGRTMKMRM